MGTQGDSQSFTKSGQDTQTGTFHLPSEPHEEDLRRARAEGSRDEGQLAKVSGVHCAVHLLLGVPVHSAPGWAAPPSSFQEAFAT